MSFLGLLIATYELCTTKSLPSDSKLAVFYAWTRCHCWSIKTTQAETIVIHGILVNSALASGARGPIFSPQQARKNLVPKQCFLSVICRDDTKIKCAIFWIGMLTEGPPCSLKNPTVIYTITCRLSSCKNLCAQCTPAWLGLKATAAPRINL